jgi:hypothetical protein
MHEILQIYPRFFKKVGILLDIIAFLCLNIVFLWITWVFFVVKTAYFRLVPCCFSSFFSLFKPKNAKLPPFTLTSLLAMV